MKNSILISSTSWSDTKSLISDQAVLFFRASVEVHGVTRKGLVDSVSKLKFLTSTIIVCSYLHDSTKKVILSLSYGNIYLCYPELNKWYRQCLLQPALASKPLLVKFHKTSIFGQNIGAINYLETIWKPILILADNHYFKYFTTVGCFKICVKKYSLVSSTIVCTTTE